MQLYQHQKEIVDQNPTKSGLWLGTGSGKTRTSLALSEGMVLVICPKTQRDDENWQREVYSIGIDCDLTVMSKEEFRRDVDKLVEKGITFDTIIVDEAHTCLGVTPNIQYRNKQPQPKASQLFYALYKYTRICKPKRLYLVTATIVKSPMTVWGAGVILGKFSMESFYKFRQIYYVKLPMSGREVYAPKKDEETKKRLAGVVRNLGYVGRLEDYFDVPEQTFKNEYVELTTEQKKAISRAKIEYPDPIVAIGKIHQIENGVLAGDEYNEAQKFKENKIERIIEYSYEFPRMIVFAKYTQQINLLAEALRKEGRKVFIMTGKTSNRGELLEELKNKDEYVLIVQAQISAGWELPECPVMIFASMTYSFVDRVQAEGRILRASKLKKNLYITLMARYPDSIDVAIKNSINNKKDFDIAIYAKQMVESS